MGRDHHPRQSRSAPAMCSLTNSCEEHPKISRLGTAERGGPNSSLKRTY